VSGRRSATSPLPLHAGEEPSSGGKKLMLFQAIPYLADSDRVPNHPSCGDRVVYINNDTGYRSSSVRDSPRGPWAWFCATIPTSRNTSQWCGISTPACVRARRAACFSDHALTTFSPGFLSPDGGQALCCHPSCQVQLSRSAGEAWHSSHDQAWLPSATPDSSSLGCIGLDRGSGRAGRTGGLGAQEEKAEAKRAYQRVSAGHSQGSGRRRRRSIVPGWPPGGED
jgi:hypothetical protein